MQEKRAQCVVQSWLLSWGIPYEVREGKLVVEGQEAVFSPVKVLSKDFAASMAEMKRLLQRFGKEMPEPPRAPPGRRAPSDDLLARSMRLTAFAKTANPPEDVLVRYQPIVKREADRAHRQFSNLNRALLLEADDYLSVGMVFLTIYLHRYQDLERESRNGADLTLYLQQEFRHWDRVLHHDLPSIALDARGMLAEQFMQAPVPGAQVEWWNTWGSTDDEGRRDLREPSYVMPEYVEPEPEEGPIDEKAAAKAARKRRREAQAKLDDALRGMGHDGLVDALSGVMLNPYLDPDARDLAGDLFHDHMGECKPCTVAWEAWDEERGQRRKYMTRTERAEAAQAHSFGIST